MCLVKKKGYEHTGSGCNEALGGVRAETEDSTGVLALSSILLSVLALGL